MIVWIIESESGIKLLYKSFLKTNVDEDIVSGFLTALNQFSVIEFKQSLESIEMGKLKWIYTVEPKYNLLFVIADTKHERTEILTSKLNTIKEAFIKEFKHVWDDRDHTWDGNLKVFSPFLKIIEDYYQQWEKVESLTQVADYFDILGVIQTLLIKLRNIVENKMYSKSKKEIYNHIEQMYNTLKDQEEFRNQKVLEEISFSKDAWFNIVDVNLIKGDPAVVIKYLQSIFKYIVDILKEMKGNTSCFKYFNDEGVYAYIFNNIKLLRDLNLDVFLLKLFLLL